MSEDDLYDRLVAYLTQVDAETKLLNPAYAQLTRIVRDHQSGPRPSGDYALVQVLEDRDLGEIDCDTWRDVTVAGAQRAVQSKRRAVEWLVRIIVYGDEPLPAARRFATHLRSEQGHLLMAPYGIRRVERAERAPELAGEVYEGRALFTAAITGVVTDDILMDTVETSTVTIEGRNGGAVVTDTSFTVEKP